MQTEPHLIVANYHPSTHVPHCVDWSRENCVHGSVSRTSLLLAPNGSRGYLDGFCGIFFLKDYQERRRAFRLRRQGFVSDSTLGQAAILSKSTGNATPSSYIWSHLPTCQNHVRASQRRSSTLSPRSNPAVLLQHRSHLLPRCLAFLHPDSRSRISGDLGPNHYRACLTQISSDQGFPISSGERQRYCLNGWVRVEALA